MDAENDTDQMRWTQDQLNEYQARRAASRSKPQHVVCDESVAEAKGEAGNANGRVVCIKSFRRRLLDTDNLVGGVKYFVDSLRYAQLIHDDTEASITLEVSQTKVKTKAEERTEITVTGAVEMAQEGENK